MLTLLMWIVNIGYDIYNRTFYPWIKDVTGCIQMATTKIKTKDSSFSDDDEVKRDYSYRWMWMIKTPPNHRLWRVLMKGEHWMDNFDICKEEGLKQNFDIPCMSNISLHIEILKNGQISWCEISI